MKKIIKIIITLSIIFSSLNATFANEWYIDNLFNLNIEVEKTKLNLLEIKYFHFNNEKYNKLYNELNIVNKLLKKWFIKNYNDWIYSYYQINWIITNYNNFIYYTNQFFFFTKLKENNNKYKECNSAILKSIINMKNSYIKVKNIVK
jgi:hypothetical protein